MRLRACQIAIAIFLALLASGLFFVQIFRGRYLYGLSLRNSIRVVVKEPYRGRIFDRNNYLLADNALSFDACIIPQELERERSVFAGLARILSLDEKDIARKYRRGFLNSFTPVVVVSGISREQAISLEEARLDLAGVRAELGAQRFYPYGPCASHVLGYIGEIDKARMTKLKDYGYDFKDKVGYSGMEEKLDAHLRGQKGGEQIEVDSQGRQVRLLGFKPPFAGRDAVLTIDIELQQIADSLFGGRKGSIVIMDANNGDILVLSSAPAFDPNVFISRKDKKALNYLLTSPEAPLLNRSVSGQFPPGSIFKVVTALAAFKVKKMPVSTTYVCKGRLKVGDRYFKCWATHGPQDFFGAMAHSCDVYFYQLGISAGADQLANMAREFGLAHPTGIDFPQEAAGFIPSRMWKRLSRFENWYDGDTANFSIGQGYVLTTPLQLARLMAAVANGGYLLTPVLTKAIGGVEKKTALLRPLKVDPEDLELVRRSLRFPVAAETGTAHVLDIEGLDISAKTGTAQVQGAQSHGWVAGFFPSQRPRYAFCIFLEHGGSSHQACELGRQLFEEGARRHKF